MTTLAPAQSFSLIDVEDNTNQRANKRSTSKEPSHVLELGAKSLAMVSSDLCGTADSVSLHVDSLCWYAACDVISYSSTRSHVSYEPSISMHGSQTLVPSPQLNVCIDPRTIPASMNTVPARKIAANLTGVNLLERRGRRELFLLSGPG